MELLNSLELNDSQIGAIRRRYGNEVEAILSSNPYRLALEVPGIGFATVDAAARSLGFGLESDVRVKGGIYHALRECAAEGHVYYPRLFLVQRCQKLLEVKAEAIDRAIDSLVETGGLVVEDMPGETDAQTPLRPMKVYLQSLHTAETKVAETLLELKRHPRKGGTADSSRPTGLVSLDDAALRMRAQETFSFDLAESQLAAISTALKSKVTVITGGPGTGKTTIIRALTEVLGKTEYRAILAAPTGRGAKRMEEATGKDAATIHRLLEFSPHSRRFGRDRSNPLACDWLILDESSMVDLKLMRRLLEALPPTASLVLVGDANQLPSIGAGRVLRDIIASRTVPVVELNQVFRQAGGSRIVMNAHRVQVGLLPEMDEEGDFMLIREDMPEEVIRLIVELCRDRFPRHFRLDPMKDVQVLCPMNRGSVGADRLNRVLQEALNPGGAESIHPGDAAANRPRDPAVIRHGSRHFRIGDKVMQVRNNYEKEVYNGDMGRIAEISKQDRRVRVMYDNRSVSYTFEELSQISLAYAVSVHKAQGSEFPAVVLPLLMQHFRLLERNLLYTAITRAKKAAVLVGDEKALSAAVKNTETRSRCSDLHERLRRLEERP